MSMQYPRGEESAEDRNLRVADARFQQRVITHPNSGFFGGYPDDPREQMHTIGLVRAAKDSQKAKAEKREMDELTAKFSKLSLNDLPEHDHNVMSVVRSIFMTDR